MNLCSQSSGLYNNACIIELVSQAHVLHLLIGNKASNMTGKAVKLGGYQWKVEQHNVRKWKLWVRFHLTMIIFNFVSMKYNCFIPAEKGCPGSADGGHYLLLDCICNRSLRWSTIFASQLYKYLKKVFFSKFCLRAKSLPTTHVLCRKNGQSQNGI